MKTLRLRNQAINYKRFKGSIVQQYPRLQSQGMVPLSISDVMRIRLEVLNPGYKGKVRREWWNEQIDTGDGVALHPDGRVKLILDTRELLQYLNPRSELINGALPLSGKNFTNLKGPEFGKDEVKRYTQRRYASINRVIDNPLLQILARDKALLSEYARAFFALTKGKAQCGPIMAVNIYSPKEEIPAVQLLGIHPFNRGEDGKSDIVISRNDYSCLDVGLVGYGLDHIRGNLVGVTPQMQNSLRKVYPSVGKVSLEKAIEETCFGEWDSLLAYM